MHTCRCIYLSLSLYIYIYICIYICIDRYLHETNRIIVRNQVPLQPLREIPERRGDGAAERAQHRRTPELITNTTDTNTNTHINTKTNTNTN